MNKTKKKRCFADKRVYGRGQCHLWTAPVAGVGWQSERLALPSFVGGRSQLFVDKPVDVAESIR